MPILAEFDDAALPVVQRVVGVGVRFQDGEVQQDGQQILKVAKAFKHFIGSLRLCFYVGSYTTNAFQCLARELRLQPVIAEIVGHKGGRNQCHFVRSLTSARRTYNKHIN